MPMMTNLLIPLLFFRVEQPWTLLSYQAFLTNLPKISSLAMITVASETTVSPTVLPLPNPTSTTAIEFVISNVDFSLFIYLT